MKSPKYILIILLLMASLSVLARNTTPTFGIITAVPSEAQLIINAMHNKQHKTINGIKYVAGDMHNKQVVLVVGGAGIINTTVTTVQLINNFHPQYILFSGTAGGVNQNLNVGDVLLVKKAYFLDIGDQNSLIPTFPNFGPNPIKHGKEKAVFTANSALFDSAKTIATKIKLLAYSKNGKKISAAVYSGSIATSMHFPNTNADTTKMRKLNIDAVAMETAAMFNVCWLYNQKCFAVRGISNKLLLNEKTNKYTSWNKVNERLASNNAGKVVVAIVSRLALTFN